MCLAQKSRVIGRADLNAYEQNELNWVPYTDIYLVSKIVSPRPILWYHVKAYVQGFDLAQELGP
jgi:hypothetical protein